mmetsp:Transcript_12192/g.49086  ORF Transcript_12192/g.49086 Transcript_12192/m.49086 type:complete len:249 (+) Transcript_12192:947-1693(+)
MEVSSKPRRSTTVQTTCEIGFFQAWRVFLADRRAVRRPTTSPRRRAAAATRPSVARGTAASSFGKTPAGGNVPRCGRSRVSGRFVLGGDETGCVVTTTGEAEASGEEGAPPWCAAASAEAPSSSASTHSCANANSSRPPRATALYLRGRVPMLVPLNRTSATSVSDGPSASSKSSPLRRRRRRRQRGATIWSVGGAASSVSEEAPSWSVRSSKSGAVATTRSVPGIGKRPTAARTYHAPISPLSSSPA